VLQNGRADFDDDAEGWNLRSPWKSNFMSSPMFDSVIFCHQRNSTCKYYNPLFSRDFAATQLIRSGMCLTLRKCYMTKLSWLQPIWTHIWFLGTRVLQASFMKFSNMSLEIWPLR
jgi:hypothetical protein